MKSRQDFKTDAEWWEYYRQYTAAMAMQGIVSNNNMSYSEDWIWLSKVSVEAADALINQLNK